MERAAQRSSWSYRQGDDRFCRRGVTPAKRAGARDGLRRRRDAGQGAHLARRHSSRLAVRGFRRARADCRCRRRPSAVVWRAQGLRRRAREAPRPGRFTERRMTPRRPNAVPAKAPLRVPFFRPSIGREEIEEVIDTLQSGHLTSGPKAARFEQEFAKFLGAPHAVPLSSATAALHLALEAVGVEAGDLVIATVM